MIESQFYQPEIQNDQYQFHRQKRDEDSIIDASYIQVCYDQKKHTIIPLQNVNYHLKILQGVQIIELQQIYSTEKYDYPLELEYIFSINENAAVTKMRVELGEKIIYGIIKEKEEAKEQYYKGIRKGKTMVYSEEDQKFPQIKRVIIGQLAPQKQLKINFQYIQPLDVFLNKFWKVDIYPIIDKNYFYLNENNQIRNNKIINYLNSKFKLTEFNFSYKQDIQITLDIGSDITFWKSPTHSLHSLDEKVNEVKNNGSNKILILKLDNIINFIYNQFIWHLSDQFYNSLIDLYLYFMKIIYCIPENQNPEKQFTLLFSSDDINLPRAILTHIVDQLILHFIPISMHYKFRNIVLHQPLSPNLIRYLQMMPTHNIQIVQAYHIIKFQIEGIIYSLLIEVDQ